MEEINKMESNTIQTNIVDTKSTANPFIDKVTLELLMNKNHYNRYLKQNDPKKHEEYLLHLEKIKQYKQWILRMTEDYLENSDHQVTTEINEAFDFYVKTLIRHFDYKKLERDEDPKEEDMLFGEMDDDITEDPPVSASKSFWGKQQVAKKSASLGFPMNYIPRIQEK